MSAKTYDKQTGAFLAKLAECMPKLTGTEMQTWIENPKALKAKLNNALSSPCVISLPGAMTKIWRTIRLGVGPRDAERFYAALLAAHCQLSDAATEIINTPAFTVAPTPLMAKLVAVTVADLGFLGRAKYSHICERGVELGLGLCPAEVGPQLRLQYPDQPKGEWVYLAMETIADSFDNSRGFIVAHGDEGLCLNSHGGIPGRRYESEDIFSFLAPM